MRRALLIPFLMIPLASAAQAQSVESLKQNGRYQLMEINDRIVRLDMQTGAFDLCGMTDGKWDCQPTRDRSRDLAEEVTKLSARVERLEAALSEEQAAKAALAAEKDKGIVRKITSYVPGLGW